MTTLREVAIRAYDEREHAKQREMEQRIEDARRQLEELLRAIVGDAPFALGNYSYDVYADMDGMRFRVKDSSSLYAQIICDRCNSPTEIAYTIVEGLADLGWLYRSIEEKGRMCEACRRKAAQ